MKILLVEPFFTGSHQRWATSLQRASRHEVRLLQLPGRYWKWRMHGGAITLAKQFLSETWQPDLILATDMLDLNLFLSLTRKRLAQVPSVLYFHENQLTYPWSTRDQDPRLKRDRHYGFINLSSALAADAVWFNSHYHQQSFLAAAASFLRDFPDFQETETVDIIRQKSKVLPLGLNFAELEQPPPSQQQLPVILWNHRWEYDKNPESFFRTLIKLKTAKFDFRLIVLGEQYREQPPIFKEAEKALAREIIHFGYAKDRKQYAQLLWTADLLPVTSQQDFFGISAVEAIYCNCYPLLPRRLAFPEHIPDALQDVHLYDHEEALFTKLQTAIANIQEIRSKSYQHFVSHYDWRNLGSSYDLAFDQVAQEKKSP